MPPKKQKKQPHNPFYFFMLDWKKEQLEMGRSVPGPMNLLAEAATPDWKSLSEADKEYYKAKAKVAKEEDKTNLHNKFTTDGKSYAQVYAEQKEVDDFIAAMDKEISETIQNISQKKNTLLYHKFYLIHANHYCFWSAKNIYIPCEVAIAEYSIEQGVIRTLHFFPAVIGTEEGRLPVGYLHEAQGIAKRTHCVPLPPMPRAEDYELITARLLSFLTGDGKKLPPLYTMENNVNCNYSMSTVKDFLANCEEFCEVQFRTYKLDQLFYELKNACADFSIREGIKPNAEGFPTYSLAQMELDRDIFHFAKGISCEYHEDLGSEQDEYGDQSVTQFCSLSTVQRWCFLISDYCCSDVGVKLKPGKHCPRNADVSYHVSNESRGFDAPGPSTSRTASAAAPARPTYVDAPPPAVNSWGKGPPKMDVKPKEEPKTATTPTAAASKTPVPKPPTTQTPTNAQPQNARPPTAQPANAQPTTARAPSSESPWRVNGAAAAEPQGASAEQNDFPALDGFRLPKTRGRGERLLAAMNRVQLDAEKEDFPALGGGRGRGRF